jgi:hypothetical protein
MQDYKDPQAFTIVERFASEDSQKSVNTVPGLLKRHGAVANHLKIPLGESVLEDLRSLHCPTSDETNRTTSPQRA